MSAKAQVLLLEPIRCAAPFSAYGLSAPCALAGGPASILPRCMHSLAAGTAAAGMGEPTLWLDTRDLHKDGGSKLLGANGRRWAPAMGFCFDPSGPPPRKLQMSDLTDMEYGGTLRLDDRTAIHVANLQETLNAHRMLAGRGLAVLLFFGTAALAATEAAVASYMKNTQVTMRPLMSPGQFQNFPFYLPLLTMADVADGSAERLSVLLGTAEIYLREYDGQLLLLSRRRLEPLFAAAGLQPAEPADSGAWIFPEELFAAGA